MNIVLGSGPTGSACAEALLDQGKPVIMVDAGLRLEDNRQALLDQIHSKKEGALRELLLHHDAAPPSGGGLPSKLVHGSDFPYRNVEEALGFSARGTGFAPSLAVGGFSNVWGAAALPYRSGDIADWPLSQGSLDPHYRAVLAMTGLAAQHDDLEELFPLFTDRPAQLKSSSQAEALLAILGRTRMKLQSKHLTFGHSRLMVDPACVYCGHCLTGCPYNLIYNSATDLQRRQSQTDSLPFRYVTDLVVEEAAETSTSVIVRGFHRIRGTPMELTGDRLFLAAGAMATSRIVMKSRGIYDQPVQLKDSQYFLFPLLTRSRAADARHEALHTLSQLFLEVNEPALSPFTIHLQLYTYSDMMRKSVRDRLWFLPGLRGIVTDALMPHLIIVQGYLHSEHSGNVSLQLNRLPGARDAFVARGIPNPATPALLKRVLDFLQRRLGPLGLHVIKPALEITQPGRGFHTGGSFPMRPESSDLACDSLGRLRGWNRIHLVDASIFPTIPATTITLPAMANAHRIATKV